jgi:hypothetical protein
MVWQKAQVVMLYSFILFVCMEILEEHGEKTSLPGQLAGERSTCGKRIRCFPSISGPLYELIAHVPVRWDTPEPDGKTGH